MMLKKILLKLMNPVMQWLCITCRDTSPVISEMMDHKVSFLKIWRVKIHLAVCGACQCYKTQLETVNLLANKLAREDSPGNSEVRLSPEAKSEIQKALKTEH